MSHSAPATPLRFDGTRIAERIAALAGMTDPALPPYTRRAFTEAFQTGRRWLAGEMAAAGLSARVDAGGNLIGVRPGTEAGTAPIVVGSHSDTVVGGGRFDGIAGVIAGLEVAQRLAEQGIALRHPLWVVDFLAEEPTDFGTSCIGSRAMAGTLSPAMLQARSLAGESLAEALRRIGGAPEQLAQGPLYGPQPFAACLELHIEQGPVLERESLDVGVVSGVVGIRRVRLSVQGQADHAGTTPMPLRRDALFGAAEVIRLVHLRAREAHEVSGLVATVGRMSHTPNQTNVVPGSAEMDFETRCASMPAAVAFVESVIAEGRATLAASGLTLTDTLLQDTQPTAFAPSVQDAIGAAAEALGYGRRVLQSGAGHDAMHLAALCPAGMVFVPCRAGRSHAHEEFASTEAVGRGTEVLLEAVRRLDRELA